AGMDTPGQLPDDHLILDEVTQQLATTFQLLSGDPDEAAERALAEIGVDTRTEAALLGEIAAAGPLAHPDRFEQSHRLVMRALEVLDRDGWKHPVLRRLGPFSGAAGGAVQFVARTRIQADRLTLGYKGGSLPLPTVLIGGAAVPVLASIARQFGAVKGQGPLLIVPLGVILAIVFALLAWVLLQGAGLAHRRIKVTLDPSLAALYETIGHCGNPPRDDSAAIAAAAIALTALAWFVVPIAIAIIATFL